MSIPTEVAKSDVSAAEFSLYQTHQYNCTVNNSTLLYHPAAGVTSTTTWNSHHGYMDDASPYSATHPNGYIDSKNTSLGIGCPNGAGWVRFDVTPEIQAHAAASAAQISLGVRAQNEGSMVGGWKRFQNNASLSITYNNPPDAPTDLQVDSAAVLSGGVYLVDQTDPTFSAWMRDRNTGQQVKGRFRITVVQGDREVYLSDTQMRVNPSRVEKTIGVGANLQDGVRYRLQVWALDGTGLISPAGPTLDFMVDQSGPEHAPDVQVAPGYDAEYPEGAWSGGIHQVGGFTFVDPDGTPDVAQIQYSFDSDAMNRVLAYPPAPVASFDPPSQGIHSLYYRSVDAAGNFSPSDVYYFYVLGPDLIARWRFYEHFGTTAHPDGGVGPDLTLRPGTDWTGTGAVDSWLLDGGILLDAQGEGASAAGPVVNTGDSFTVAALVKITDVTATRVAVSQNGVNTSGFNLGFVADDASCPQGSGPDGCWQFWMADSDSTGQTPTIVKAMSQRPVATGHWTWLIGTFDDDANRIQVQTCTDDTWFLENPPTTPVRRAGAWQATNNFQVGRAQLDGQSSSHWRGKVDDVRVFNGPQSSQAAEICGSSLPD